MATAFEVASYLIHLAGEDPEPDFLTNLRMQKLLYYVQGWALAGLGHPMFLDRIEAWAYGPVVPAVYQFFKGFDHTSITPDAVPEPSSLNAEERLFIRAVWSAYKGYSATALVKMVHAENPWREARAGLGDGENSCREITVDSIKSWFEPQASERFIPGLPVQAAFEAAAEPENGTGERHAEVFAALRIVK